jgi:hypothetical protein
MSVGVSFGGTAQFSINGQLYSLSGAVKVKVGGVTRKAAIGPSGPTGNWIETWIEPEIEVEVFDDPANSVTALQAVTGATVQVQGRNGKTYLLYNAFVTDALEPDVVAGKFSLKLSGSNCIEVA